MTYLILSLATWRIASLLVNERGPLHVFQRIRELVGITHDDAGEIEVIPDGFLPELLSCVWCCSVWCGMFWTLVYIIFGDVSGLLALPFALSAFAVAMDKVIRKI